MDASANSLIIILAFIIMALCAVHSSGITVGFLYDARNESDGHRTPNRVASFLERNKVLPSQFKVLITKPATNLYSLTSTGIAAHLYLSEFEAQKLVELRAGADLIVESYVSNTVPSIEISSIIVGSDKLDIASLRLTLSSIRRAVKNSKLNRRIKVSVLLPLSRVKALGKLQFKFVQELVHFMKKMDASLIIEVVVDGELRMRDDFAYLVVESVLSTCTIIPYLTIPMVLHVKSWVVCSGVEMANFTVIVMKLMSRHQLISNRISELYVDISHLRVEQEKLTSEGQMLLPSHRELLDHSSGVNTATKIMVRDDGYIPITNPATTGPITVPSTNPSPTVVTIPSTNPVTFYPTNPTMTPVTLPSQNPTYTPVYTPITVPATDPMQTPVVPVTNPVTTPSTTYPLSPTITNPATTYPATPAIGNPYEPPPFTVPSTVPVTPAVSGQTWCVAKTGVTDQYIQSALDYACGSLVDCSQLQPTGSCYYPNTLQAHASYAFNSYYQRNPVATSCDFGGTAMLVNVNPSSATCIFTSSSSTSTSNPASTYTPTTSYNPTYNPLSGVPGYSTGSGSSIFNSNNPGGSNSVFGSYSPTSSVNKVTHSASWIFLLLVVNIVYLSTNI